MAFPAAILQDGLDVSENDTGSAEADTPHSAVTNSTIPMCNFGPPVFRTNYTWNDAVPGRWRKIPTKVKAPGWVPGAALRGLAVGGVSPPGMLSVVAFIILYSDLLV